MMIMFDWHEHVLESVYSHIINYLDQTLIDLQHGLNMYDFTAGGHCALDAKPPSLDCSGNA